MPTKEHDQGFASLLLIFLKLGLTSFGGPIAHLGYFRHEFVLRRRWLDEAAYADLVALCQFLPGPASSQAGFALGVLRGQGLAGGIAAWLGFTLPSALLLFAFALSAAAFGGPLADGLAHGLKLVAVAVVAHALWGMARNLTPDAQRIAIGMTTFVIVSFIGNVLAQVGAIAFGALAGLVLCRTGAHWTATRLQLPVSHTSALFALSVFGLLLIGLPLRAAEAGQAAGLFDAFYRAGALVFGGGHVVLPLLEAEVVAHGWVSTESFLAGYGLAQAVPGPLFTFAAYLGAAAVPEPNGFAGAAIALVAIFLPGLLLVYGVLPYWNRLRTIGAAQAALRGANAAVVGILASAFYDPVLRSAIFTPLDLALAAGGFLLLARWNTSPWVVVLLLAAAGAVMPLI